MFSLFPIIKRVTHSGIKNHIMAQKYMKPLGEWLSPLFYSPKDRDSGLISDNECSGIFRCFLKYVLLNNWIIIIYYFLCLCSPARAMASLFTRFRVHTQRRATVSRTPLNEWLARRRDLYLTTHNTHNRHTFMPPVGFEPTIAAGERS
jgi:hypothetical protein